MSEQVELAPEYRYFTVDFLTNETLAEIPYRGVSYGRALKGAGEFQGKIPVIPQTESLDLYENTMPGKTALFVVRNGVCVWGGLIWNREYDVVTRDLSISASEFTSYLYRRFIWKTWNHEYGATFIVSGGMGKIILANGSNTMVAPGSTVHVDFYEPSNFQYNGYYRVAATPTPTLDGFSVVGGTAIADIASVEVAAGEAKITTNSFHGFSTGDLITVDSGYGAPFDGTFEITASGGSNTTEFTYSVSSGDIERTADSGTAVRPVPDGVYTDVTVAVRSDTWDYVRSLLDSAFNDFVGTDFPNVYIEPGVSYGLDTIEKKLDGGFATITTSDPHDLAVGQAVQVQDVGTNFDGEFEVIATPSDNQFMYAAGGTLAATAVTPLQATITGIALYNNIATITTSASHNYVVGNIVNIFVGYDYAELNGDQEITAILSPTSFQYVVASGNTIPAKTLLAATATSGGVTVPIVSSKIKNNKVTLTAGDAHNFAVGQSVQVKNVNRSVFLKEKSLDAPNSVANITTEVDHHFLGPEAVRTNIFNGTMGTLYGAITTGISYLGDTWSRTTGGARAYANLSDFVSNMPYIAQWEVANDTGSPVLVGVDMADRGTVNHTIAPGERKIISAYTSIAWDSTYRFSDIEIGSGSLLFRNILIEAGTEVKTYFNGASMSNGFYAHAWTGTAFLSSSVRVPLVNGASIVAYNQIPNPGGESASGFTSVVRTNYAADPQAVTATSWFSLSGGTPATSTDTIATDRFHQGTTSFKRAITGTGQTGAAAKPATGTTLRINNGEWASWGFWVYSTKAGSLTMYADGANVVGGGYNGLGGATVITVPANVWTYCSASYRNNTGQDMYLTQVGGYNLSVVSGDTIWFDEFLIEKGPLLGSWFSGATASSGDFIYGWAGTANASSSQQLGPALTGGWGPNGEAVVWQSTSQAYSGAKSIAIMPTGNTVNAGLYVTLPNFYIGQTYTAIVRVKGGLGAVTSFTASNFTINNTIAANNPTWTEYRHQFVASASTHDIYIYAATGATPGSVMYVDVVSIIPGAYDGAPFTGADAPSGDNIFSWEGTANASRSIKYSTGAISTFNGTNLITNPNISSSSGTATVRTNLIPNPKLATASMGWDFLNYGTGALPTRNASISLFGSRPGIELPRATTGAVPVAQRGASGGIAVVPGQTYAFSGLLVVPAGVAVSIDMNWYSAGLAYLGNARQGLSSPTSGVTGSNTTIGVDNTPQRVGPVGVAPAGAATVELRVYIDGGGTGTAYATDFMFERASFVSSYFDGSGPYVGSDYTYAWTGTANNSTSTQIGRVPSTYVFNNGGGDYGFITQSADQAHSGSYSIKAVSMAGSGGYSGIRVPVALTPDTYTMSAWVYQPAAYSSGGVGILATPTTGFDIGTPTTVTGSWVRISHTFVIRTTETVDLYILTGSGSSPAPGAVFYVDDIMLTQGVLRDYFDGDSSSPAMIASWSGTPNASTSSSYWRGGVVVDGLRDSSAIVLKQNSATTVTMTTEQGHNFVTGESVTIANMLDVYPIATKQLTSGAATLSFSYPHNVATGSSIVVESLIDTYTVTAKSLANNTATITTSINHNFKVNDEVTIGNIVDTSTVVSKTAENGIGILTLSAPHNYLEAEEVTITGVGAPFDGTFTLLAVTDTRIFFEVDNENSLVLPATSGGTVVGTNSIFNGVFALTAVTSNTLSFSQVGEDVASVASSGSVSGLSILNGTRTVIGATTTTLQFNVAGNNVPVADVPVADEDGEIQAVVYQPSIHLGVRTLTSITRNTFTFAQSGLIADNVPRSVTGQVSAPSIFNGSRTLTGRTSKTFKYVQSAVSNVIEEDTSLLATATSYSIFNGVYTITGVDLVNRTFTYARTYEDIPQTAVQGQGLAVVRPTAIISSFGPFPGNADFGLTYSTRQYSGKNIEPVAYRGFELTNIGEALDQYSDSINGFEYRIDCAFNEETQSFTKTFVLIPIDFPNPPAVGEVSDVSRFGADKLVFEYPGGSITSLELSESADESSTRFFAVGETDLGPDVGPNVSIASATDLLSGESDERRWPLLDDSEKIDDVDDEADLYSYAKRYLTESRPPTASFSISVNGSIAPLVGTYSPGDWCSLIIDDPFIQMRLASSLEPRDDVIVRKIESYKVSVPDSVTFPEKVTLNLVAEWEVDKRG